MPLREHKKFKKCCLSRDIIIPVGENKRKNKDKPIIIKTLTDELYQPMRLGYIVHNKEQLISCFKSLKCLVYTEGLDD